MPNFNINEQRANAENHPSTEPTETTNRVESNVKKVSFFVENRLCFF